MWSSARAFLTLATASPSVATCGTEMPRCFMEPLPQQLQMQFGMQHPHTCLLLWVSRNSLQTQVAPHLHIPTCTGPSLLHRLYDALRPPPRHAMNSETRFQCMRQWTLILGLGCLAMLPGLRMMLQ